MFHSFSVSSLLAAVLISVCITPSLADEVCPVSSEGDSGTCLTGDFDNICCGGPEGGCMWSGGQCCSNGYWCYEGYFCSTTDPTKVANGDVSCCADTSCATTAGLANENIAYIDQPGYGSAGTGAATSTFAGQGGTATGSVAVTQTTTHGSGNTASTSTAKSMSSSVSTSASQTTSKSAGQVAKKVDFIGGLYLTPLVIALFGVGVVL